MKLAKASAAAISQAQYSFLVFGSWLRVGHWHEEPVGLPVVDDVALGDFALPHEHVPAALCIHCQVISTQDPGPCRGQSSGYPHGVYKAVECLLIASIESAFYIYSYCLLSTRSVTVLEAQYICSGPPTNIAHPRISSPNITCNRPFYKFGQFIS